MNQGNSKRKSFTLIELLTVMAIIAVLMGLSLGLFSFANRYMSDSKCQSMVAMIEVAQEAYKAKTGYYLPQWVDYQATIAAGTTEYAAFFYMDDPLDDEIDFTDFIPGYEKLKKQSLKESNIQFSDGSWTTQYYLEDPYGEPFVYKNPGTKNTTTYDVQSYGVDGDDNEGGGDDIANYK